MKILVLSYFSPLPDISYGGAQQLFTNLTKGFVSRGHQLEIVCPQNPAQDALDYPGINVHTIPEFPYIEAMGPFYTLDLLSRFAALLPEVDLVWALDTQIPFEMPVPCVLTLSTGQFLQDYRDEFKALLTLNWDSLIVTSHYLRDITGPFVGETNWKGEPPLITTVPAGIDLSHFTQASYAPLAQKLGIGPSDKPILFPHRPDPSKGFHLALDLLQTVCQTDKSFKLMIPTNLEYPEDIVFYENLEKEAELRQVTQNVIFHEWINFSQMPSYYSLGHCTLVSGHFPEGFGLVAIESIACGTPVISTTAGNSGCLLPKNHGIEYVSRDATCKDIAERINSLPSKSEVEAGINYIQRHYSIDSFVDEHLRIFSTTRKNTSLFFPSLSPLRIAPWLEIDHLTRRVWHKLEMTYIQLSDAEYEALESFLLNVPPAHSNEQISALIQLGVLIGGRKA